MKIDYIMEVHLFFARGARYMIAHLRTSIIRGTLKL